MAKTISVLQRVGVEPIYDYLDFSEFHPTRQGRLRFRLNLSKERKAELYRVVDEGRRIAAVLHPPTKEEQSAAREKLADPKAVTLSETERAALQEILEARTADQITEQERLDMQPSEAIYNDDVLRLTASMVMADDETGSETLTLDEWKQFVEASETEFVNWLTGKLWDKHREYREGERFLSKR